MVSFEKFKTDVDNQIADALEDEFYFEGIVKDGQVVGVVMRGFDDDGEEYLAGVFSNGKDYEFEAYIGKMGFNDDDDDYDDDDDKDLEDLI